jgi:DNA-binding XRE family transcriptional regulator
MNTFVIIWLTRGAFRSNIHYSEFINPQKMKPQELGQVLRDRRKLAKITQSDLADLSGLSVHTLSDLESGKGNPTLEVLSRLCDVMGLEIQLVTRTPKPPSPSGDETTS